MAEAGDGRSGDSPEGKALGPEGQRAEAQTAKVANGCPGCTDGSTAGQPGGTSSPLLLSAR